MTLRTIFIAVLFGITLQTAAARVTSHNDEGWFTPSQDDLVYLTTATGDVVIMLSDAVAPAHSKRFQQLIRTGFYNKQYFYRVIDGFVAQGGIGEGSDVQPVANAGPLKAEFSTPYDADAFNLVESHAAFAPQTGFINGMPAATDGTSQWLMHCPGSVAFARSTGKDTATTEFYVVIGQAPHHLDKNMSVIGRVLDGMGHLQALPRGNMNNGGVIATPSDASMIISARLGSDLPEGKQRHFRVQRASHPQYIEKVENSRQLNHPFYHDKSLTPRTIDVCYYQTAIEEKTENP